MHTQTGWCRAANTLGALPELLRTVGEAVWGGRERRRELERLAEGGKGKGVWGQG